MKKLSALLFIGLFCTLSVTSYAAFDTLGAAVINNGDGTYSTRFRIWSPESSNVVLYVQNEKKSKAAGSPVFDSYDSTSPEYKYCSTVQDDSTPPRSYTDVYEFILPDNLGIQKPNQTATQYYFTINGVKVRDPYAKMVAGENNSKTVFPAPPSTAYSGPCQSTPLRNGVVIDLNSLPDSTSKVQDNSYFKNNTDAIIYEISVADYTSDENSGVAENNRGMFSGLMETGTVVPGTNTSTCLDHMIDLGITHVQIMPMFSFSYVGCPYNWGYSPLNYFIPQQQYSNLDADNYIGRLNEVQNMVDTFHKNGIRVVMDVVYNHTIGAIFEPITKKYYVTESNGNLENITGCGNCVNTAEPMVTNMIIDNMEYWVQKFGFDGFRFDEGQTFTYPVVQKWLKKLYTEFPDKQLMFYGEDFTCDDYTGENNLCQPGNLSATENMINEKLMPGMGGFNQAYRWSAINDYIFNKANSNNWSMTMYNMMYGFMGSIRQNYTSSAPVQPIVASSYCPQSVGGPGSPFPRRFANMPCESINYLSCHDGLTYWDNICSTINGNPGYQKRIDTFGLAILMTSQGVPFIQSGSEFLRTKQNSDGSFNGNSYDSPISVNEIDWTAKVNNPDIYDFYKQMIAMRKNHPMFRIDSLDSIKDNVSCYIQSQPESTIPAPNIMVSIIDGSDIPGEEWTQAIVIMNSGDNYTYSVPAVPSNGTEWKVGMTNANPFTSEGKTVATGTQLDTQGTAVTVLYSPKAAN